MFVYQIQFTSRQFFIQLTCLREPMLPSLQCGPVTGQESNPSQEPNIQEAFHEDYDEDDEVIADKPVSYK